MDEVEVKVTHAITICEDGLELVMTILHFCRLQDFYFRQLRKVSVGDTGVAGTVRCSLLCSSNEFGLTFVGCSKGMYMY